MEQVYWWNFFQLSVKQTTPEANSTKRETSLTLSAILFYFGSRLVTACHTNGVPFSGGALD